MLAENSFDAVAKYMAFWQLADIDSKSLTVFHGRRPYDKGKDKFHIAIVYWAVIHGMHYVMIRVSLWDVIPQYFPDELKYEDGQIVLFGSSENYARTAVLDAIKGKEGIHSAEYILQANEVVKKLDQSTDSMNHTVENWLSHWMKDWYIDYLQPFPFDGRRELLEKAQDIAEKAAGSPEEFYNTFHQNEEENDEESMD